MDSLHWDNTSSVSFARSMPHTSSPEFHDDVVSISYSELQKELELDEASVSR